MDEITNAELARRLESFALDVRSDIAEVTRRLDLYVLREVYAAEQKSVDTRLSTMERQLQASEEQRRALVRWVISAVIIPTVALIVTIVLNVQGSGGS